MGYCAYSFVLINSALGQVVLVVTAASELRQATYSDTGVCTTDAPYSVKNSRRLRCASECLRLATCEDFNYNNNVNECALFLHKPLFYDLIPGCTGFKVSWFKYSTPWPESGLFG